MSAAHSLGTSRKHVEQKENMRGKEKWKEATVRSEATASLDAVCFNLISKLWQLNFQRHCGARTISRHCECFQTTADIFSVLPILINNNYDEGSRKLAHKEKSRLNFRKCAVDRLSSVA